MNTTYSGRMKKGPVIVGVILVMVGAVFAFQGYGTLKGSVMTGSPFWMWVGIASVIAGAALLARTFKRSG